MLRTLVLTLATCVMLSGAAFAAEMRIGVADMQKAGIESDANQATRQKYEAQFNSETEQLNKEKEAFDKKAKSFESQRAGMNQKTMEERINGLRREAQKIGEKEMMLQQKIGMIQNAIAQELAELTVEAAAEVAKAKNLELVLAHNSVLFSATSYDVTQDMLTAMNRIWKANGSKPLGATAVEQAAPAQQPAARGKKK